MRRFLSGSLTAAAVGVLAMGLAGCHHQPTRTAYQAPPAERPDWASGYPRHATESRHEAKSAPERQSASGSEGEKAELRGKPSLIETGLASWYGPQYNHRAAADGQPYDQNAMTAAHRTLPLGTLARVTNLTTNESVIVRITDRGPFISGRVLDMSEGAAKAIGLYRMGVAKVRVEAYTPATASPTGIWAVQTGAFQTSRDATDLRDALLKRYRTAKVEQFEGPTGFWVRIDPAGRDHADAVAIQNWIGKPDAHANSFLVRLD